MTHKRLQPKRVFGLSNVIRASIAALALALLAGIMAPPALAGGITPPPTPPAITPPSGNVPFLVGHATGTQGYVCLPYTDGTVAWTSPMGSTPVNSSRPQATLSVTLFGNFKQQILTHFLSPNTNPNQFAPSPLPFGSPTWQSSIDSSVIWGNKLASITAGSDTNSCPYSGSIPCLLLQVIGSQNGPSYPFGILTKATYVQRLNTSGGSAPATGCAVSTDVGNQVLVPYTADYYFYSASH